MVIQTFHESSHAPVLPAPAVPYPTADLPAAPVTPRSIEDSHNGAEIMSVVPSRTGTAFRVGHMRFDSHDCYVAAIYAYAGYAGYGPADVTLASACNLARWWSPEGEQRLMAATPELACLALGQVITVFEQLPGGRPFRQLVDVLHTLTVPAQGLTPTVATRAATLWTQGRWSPGANGDMVIGIGRELHPYHPYMQALAQLGIKYAGGKRG